MANGKVYRRSSSKGLAGRAGSRDAEAWNRAAHTWRKTGLLYIAGSMVSLIYKKPGNSTPETKELQGFQVRVQANEFIAVNI